MKFCQEGNHEVPNLFWRGTKERKSACMQCARKYSKPISKGIKMIESTRPLNKPVQATKKIKPIPKVSQKMKERLRLYYKVRETYLDGNIGCEARLNGCNGTATDIHHKCGKTGDLLFDDKYFLAVCRPCHTHIELHPLEAKRKGLSLDRLTK